MATFTQITDPRLATKFSEFVTAGKQEITITFPQLCFLENRDNISYCVKSVIDDYMHEMIAASINCKLSTEQVQKYRYNPRLICSDTYGTGDLFYVILLINNMCSIKEFDLSSGYVRMLKKDDMKDFLNAIYRQEYQDLNAYNTLHNS